MKIGALLATFAAAASEPGSRRPHTPRLFAPSCIGGYGLPKTCDRQPVLHLLLIGRTFELATSVRGASLAK